MGNNCQLIPDVCTLTKQSLESKVVHHCWCETANSSQTRWGDNKKNYPQRKLKLISEITNWKLKLHIAASSTRGEKQTPAQHQSQVSRIHFSLDAANLSTLSNKLSSESLQLLTCATYLQSKSIQMKINNFGEVRLRQNKKKSISNHNRPIGNCDALNLTRSNWCQKWKVSDKQDLALLSHNDLLY